MSPFEYSTDTQRFRDGFCDALKLDCHKCEPLSTALRLFPGSDDPAISEEMLVFLQTIARFVEPGGKLLIGVDGIKDVRVLDCAYNF